MAVGAGAGGGLALSPRTPCARQAVGFPDPANTVFSAQRTVLLVHVYSVISI